MTASFFGIKKPATGPTKKAQIIVPIPKEPPSRKPARTKVKSTIIRIMLNFLWVLSLITTATRSFGPVPASDLITMVMPKAKITQPRASIISLNTMEVKVLKTGDNIIEKKSMMGPPQSMQRTVPIFM